MFYTNLVFEVPMSMRASFMRSDAFFRLDDILYYNTIKYHKIGKQ